MEHLDTTDCRLPDAQAIDSFTLQMTQFNRNPGLRLRNAQTAESFEILDQPWIQAIIFVLSSLPSFLPSLLSMKCGFNLSLVVVVLVYSYHGQL